MTDSVNDLIYGHFGQPVYDPDSQTWLFNRQPGRLKVLSVLGDPRTCITPSIHQLHPPVQTSQRSRLFERSTQQLINRIPELGLGHDPGLLSDAARTSEAVSFTVDQYDPLKSDLLAFGKAADIDNARAKGRIRVAAVAGGAVGEALRLVQVRKKRQGWKKDYSVSLEVPDFESGDIGWWAGDSAPIQQVCFAQTNDDKSNFLAVRTLNATHLFRPQCHRTLVSPADRHDAGSAYPPSRINANPVLSMPVGPTGVPHADVGFNPWYQRQFAIVDRNGKWSVYDIEGSRRTPSYKAVHFRSGALFDYEKSPCEESDSAPREDGWMRVLFVDVNHIVVCGRRQFDIFDLRGESARLRCPRFGLERDPDWFLDVRRGVHDGHVLVLTSTHLFLVCVDRSSTESDSSFQAPEANVVLSWRHFRDPEDITMQVSVFSDDEDTLVLLYSRVNNIITCFRFIVPANQPSLPCSVSDPTLLHCPFDLTSAQGSPRTIVNLSVQSLQYREDLHQHLRGDGPGHGYMDDEIQFYSLIVLYNDLSASECLLYAESRKDPVLDRSDHQVRPIEAPSWTRRRLAKSTTKVSDDDFVVEDSVDAEVPRRFAPRYSRLFPKRPSRPKLGSEEWRQWTTVDGGLLDFVEDQLQAGDEKAQDTFESVLDTIRLRLSVEKDESSAPRGTLLELVDTLPKVGEVDPASDALEEIKNTFSVSELPDEPGRVITQLASPAVLGLDAAPSQRTDETVQRPSDNDRRAYPTLVNVYERVLEKWLSPLPSNIPARHRFVSARIAKDIAAELCLASARTELYESPPAAEPETVPLESETASQMSGLLATALPTPEATPSLTSASFSTSTLSSLQDPVQSYLGQYMHIDQPLPLPTRASSRLQAHWTLGTDPNTYNYTATRLALDEAAESDAEGLSAKQRARLKRRAEKHLQRQRRETAKAAASSSQPVPLLRTMSSPGPPAGGLGVGSSSQVMPSQLPMASQVVPGTFGGRPAKRKKVRQAGF